MKISTIFCATLLATFVATSCSTNTNTAKLKAKPEVSISNQEWFLVDDNNTVKGLYDKNISIVIDESASKVSGFSGCNNFNATIAKTNGTISFGNFSETKMACPNLKAEQDFLSVLKNVNRYEIAGKELYLYKGNILLMKLKTT